ncbi:ankyrin repeat domain-containing protein [Paracraurococcus lichenis]|uniref:Ankyrin repeat domain-containing protein n=1 Tax=Paracraurococcus lichenis TaxID=3064888 RepID=A0ABT9E4R2_9PROT|nr:ankyrin repeat domain-containing protein [Paracraurococcus sp. LOR1-02]MDO9710985.1 ankyrin repeat domain-containing protein [Paracraurococcus sp. LOR1-02]
MRAPARLLPLALIALALPSGEAAAQFARGPSRVPRPDASQNATRPPPPALPGLQNRDAPAPIPGDPTQVLSPNAALFDAINRGDIAAARDAVARGADLEARNVLGLTPVDAAVDQGRNEIMFYLLSVRGGTRVAGPPEEEPPVKPAPAARGRRPAEPPVPAPAAERGVPMPAPVVRNPRLWAGDGGAANPEIGFLGFDAGRPAGAAAPVSAPAAPARRGRG